MFRGLIRKLLARVYGWLKHSSDEQKRQVWLSTYQVEATARLSPDGYIGGKHVVVGKKTYLNQGFRLVSGENSSVIIGNHCAIGRYFSCASITHDKKRPTSNESHNEHLRVENSVVIGDRVWIGDKVTIVPGITIGDDAIIGANSVVTRDVAPKEIVGGVPAKHIGFNNQEDDDGYS